MTLGVAERQGDLLDDVTRFCDEVVAPSSVYALLHRERNRLFPDELCRLVQRPGATQRAAVGGGHSDGAAAPGGPVGPRGGGAQHLRRPLALRGRRGGCDGGWGRFAHTVLVDMRARLAASGALRQARRLVWPFGVRETEHGECARSRRRGGRGAVCPFRDFWIRGAWQLRSLSSS